MQRTFDNLIFESRAFSALLSDVRSDNLSHTYLVECADGTFLKELLLRFLASAVCEKKCFCGVCSNCRRVLEGKHPDVVTTLDFSSQGQVESARKLILDAYRKPLEGDKKIYLILPADKLSQASQNTLLKLFEEPPKHTHFVLGAANAKNLLPTVASRAKKLSVERFPEGKLSEFLRTKTGDEKKIARAIALAGGYPSKALALLDDSEIDDRMRFVHELFSKCKTSADVAFWSAKLMEFERDELIEVFSSMQQYARDLMLCNVGKSHLAISPFASAENTFSNAALIRTITLLEEGMTDAKNVNLNVLCDSLLLSILEVKHLCQKL